MTRWYDWCVYVAIFGTVLTFFWVILGAPGYVTYWHHFPFNEEPPYFLSPCDNAAKQARHHGESPPVNFLCLERK